MDTTTTIRIISRIISFPRLDLGIILGILGIIVTVFLSIFFYLKSNAYQTRLKIKDQYRIIWRKASKLTAQDIFGNDYYRYKDHYQDYHKSEIDKIIKEKIINYQNILLIGSPLSGKTRTLYENLKDLNNYEVLIPRESFIFDDKIFIPKQKKSKNSKIIVLENLQKLVRKDRIEMQDNVLQGFLLEISQQNILIIATCQSEIEFDIVSQKIDINSLLNGKKENIINMPEYEREEAEKIAKEEFNLISLPETFNGTIGSLILGLDTMLKRYKALTTPQINILSAIKMLFIAGIYDSEGEFSVERVGKLCSSKKLFVNKENFLDCLREIKGYEFIKIRNNQNIIIRDVYLNNIIETGYEEENINIGIFNLIINLLNDDFEAQFLCGNKAYSIGKIQTITNKIEFIKIAIAVYTAAIKINPEYADAWYNKCVALDQLGKHDEAIKCYDEAVRINPEYEELG
ncbi:MAG: tetratricopeptide repeat protein [Candidatus Humimicrobiaceae bacterium]